MQHPYHSRDTINDAELRSAGRAMNDVDTPTPVAPRPPRRRRPAWLTPLIIVLIVLLLAGVGLAAWLLWGTPKPPAAHPSRPSADASTAPQVTKDTPITQSTRTYTDQTVGITLAYPTDWTVVNSSDSGVRIQSPDFTYTTSDGVPVKGYFRVYLRKGARDVDSKYIGHGLAVKDSEELDYAKPSDGQVSKTLLSSFGLDTTDSFNFFLIASGFHLSTGDTLGATFGKEADAYIIAGGYSADANADDLQMNSVPLNYYTTTNAYKQALEIIKSIQI